MNLLILIAVLNCGTFGSYVKSPHKLVKEIISKNPIENEYDIPVILGIVIYCAVFEKVYNKKFTPESVEKILLEETERKLDYLAQCLICLSRVDPHFSEILTDKFFLRMDDNYCGDILTNLVLPDSFISFLFQKLKVNAKLHTVRNVIILKSIRKRNFWITKQEIISFLLMDIDLFKSSLLNQEIKSFFSPRHTSQCCSIENYDDLLQLTEVLNECHLKNAIIILNSSTIDFMFFRSLRGKYLILYNLLKPDLRKYILRRTEGGLRDKNESTLEFSQNHPIEIVTLKLHQDLNDLFFITPDCKLKYKKNPLNARYNNNSLNVTAISRRGQNSNIIWGGPKVILKTDTFYLITPKEADPNLQIYALFKTVSKLKSKPDGQSLYSKCMREIFIHHPNRIEIPGIYFTFFNGSPRIMSKIDSAVYSGLLIYRSKNQRNVDLFFGREVESGWLKGFMEEKTVHFDKPEASREDILKTIFYKGKAIYYEDLDPYLLVTASLLRLLDANKKETMSYLLSLYALLIPEARKIVEPHLFALLNCSQFQDWAIGTTSEFKVIRLANIVNNSPHDLGPYILKNQKLLELFDCARSGTSSRFRPLLSSLIDPSFYIYLRPDV